ncbi:MAG: GreA/GreB family elongation factor [Cytophagaceae bacterium]|nr:GreA/GreB family elongation factor [Cytophagaceae bacterium]
MHSLKPLLHQQCLRFAEERIAAAQTAIEDAQASANEETKSSAGDKYETGRSMMQLEIEKNSAQLAEGMKLKQTLSLINPDNTSDKVLLGSLVITGNGIFYIAISAGQIKLDNKIFFAVSPVSPIGALLMGKKSGDQVEFNGKKFSVKEVY